MLVDDDFIAAHWRPRIPALLRGAAASQPACGVARADLMALCAPPVVADILVATASGEHTRRRVPAVTQVPQFGRRYLGAGRNLIFYLYELARCDPRFETLLGSLPPAFAYRLLGLLCAVSDRDSHFELHADLIDTIMIQLSGRRRWTVYRPRPNPGYLRYLHGLTATRPPLRYDDEPVVDAVLEAGDVLYLPSPWPHVATTRDVDDESVSVSAGFATFTGLRALRLAAPTRAPGDLSDPVVDRLCEPLSDPPPEVEPAQFIANTLAGLLPAAAIDIGVARARIAAANPVAIASHPTPQAVDPA